MFQILLWSSWKYRCGDSVRSEWPLWHAAKTKAVFARRRIKVKAEPKLKKQRLLRKLLDIREKKNARAVRGLLATDHIILNHGQVMWTTPELAPPLLATTPHQRENVSALDRFNVHCCPTRRVFSGTGLELVTRSKTQNSCSEWWCKCSSPEHLASCLSFEQHQRFSLQDLSRCPQAEIVSTLSGTTA
ncbi:uncharacterized protein TNCV_5105881 [Trichonephila clavipes]|nr:uncharacterized protein TNCV_5105881 [Trichonephila clavipes]